MKENEKKLESNENSLEVGSDVKKVDNESVKKPKSKLIKNSLIGLVIFIAILGLTLIPIKKRTTLGRVFDGVGLHKVAMLTDRMVNGHSGIFSGNFFAMVDLNDSKSFEKVWDKVKDESLKFEAMSTQGNWAIYPGNIDKRGTFNISGSGKFNVSLKDQKMAGDVKLVLNADGSELGLNSDDAKIGVEISSKLALDKNDTYFKLEKLKTDVPQVEELSIDLGFDDWYAKSNDLSDEQKGALVEMTSLITELTEVKPSDILSDETGRQVFKGNYEDFYKEINVGGVKKVEFGKDEKTEAEVREIDIVVNDEILNEDMKSTQKKNFSNMEKVLNDKSLQNFVKNDFYDWLVKFEEQANILAETEGTDIQTKDEFGKDFDDYVDSFNKNKEATLDSYDEEDLVNELGKVETVEYKIYLEPGSNDFYGFKIKMKFVYSEEALDKIKSSGEAIYDLYKDGLVVEIESYENKLNDKVSTIEMPDETKSFDEFLEEVSQNTKVTNFMDYVEETVMQGLGVGGFSSSNGGSVMYQDKNTEMFIYYDADKQMSYQIVGSNEQKREIYYLDENEQLAVVPNEVVVKFFTETTSASAQNSQENSGNMSDEEKKEVQKMIME